MTASRRAGLVLATLAAWCLAITLRGIWTPDEPRELALAASQAAHFTALPSLGGRPFTEKPPLAYWISGAAMRAFDVGGPAARLPQILYALVAAGAVFLLGRRMGGSATGTIAALVFSTGTLVFNTQIWLATDALLLAAVSLALLGAFVIFDGPARGAQFWAGCACLHLGLVLALFTKNFAGWLVPVTTMGAFALAQRRSRLLWHPGVWLPALGSVALLWWWARHVAAAPGGAQSMHALFWDNLAGRLGSYVDSSETVRALGHRNWPGKYLVELPIYLLPWTPVFVGAVVRLWRDRRSVPMSGATRFAVAAFLPALVLLSFAATSRGVYAAPIMPGMALLVAIAFTSQGSVLAVDPVLRASCRWTTWLVLAVDGMVLAAIVALHAVRGIGDLPGLLIAVAGLAVVFRVCLGLHATLRDGDAAPIGAERVIVRLAGAHVAALIAIALSLFPLLDRAQSLQRIATFIESASHGHPLVLWLPDETTLAMSDLWMRKPTCSIPLEAESAGQRSAHLSACLAEHPDAAVVAMRNCEPHECNRSMRIMTRDDPFQRLTLDFEDADLAAAHVRSVDGLVRPGGRAYLIGFRTP